MIIKREAYYHGKLRMLHIHLPEGYDDTDERYPVMYYFDGHNLFLNEDATYGKSWGLEEYLNSWPKKMIVVGMECGHVGRERLNEYCPYSFHSAFLGDITGEGEQVMTWIAEDIKPMIDREYRTWSHREATGICGSSMGGLMALYAAIRFNGVFSKAACLSSAVGDCTAELLAEIDLNDIHPDTRVYLSWGTEEAWGAHGKTVARNHALITGKLEERGALCTIYRQEQGHHCEADWEKQNERYLPFLWL